MSIAPPRESSMPPNRRSTPHINTPIGSARPSIDSPGLQAPSRSDSVSPNRALPPRRNRAALREYYNLKNNTSGSTDNGNGRKDDDASSEFSVNDHSLSDVIESELDSSSFSASTFVQKVLREQSLAEVLKTYNGILQEIRGLNAEKKALVYDNYSKLIKATETIGRMRENMGTAGNGKMVGTLDPAISDIYRRAAAIKQDLKGSLSPEQQREAELSEEEKQRLEKRRRAQESVRRVLEVPERIRAMVKDGRAEEARREWETIRNVLESWRKQGKGGEDVERVYEDGEAALSDEAPEEKS